MLHSYTGVIAVKKILIAVNEDPISKHVIETAGALAQQLNASVVVCHIMPKRVFESIQDGLKWQRYVEQPFTYEQAENQAKSIAYDVAQGLKKFSVRWEARGFVGEPAPEIVRLAHGVNAELIVMGFAGLHGLGKLRALGSVSRAVMEQTTLPVLIVPAIQVVAEESVVEKQALKGALINERKLHPIS